MSSSANAMAKSMSKIEPVPAIVNKWGAGAFVFLRTSKSVPQTPEAIKQLVLAHGLPEALVPDYVGDRATASRAVAGCNQLLSKKGWLVRSIRSSREHVVWGITREEKDKEHTRLEYDFEATVEWTKEVKPDGTLGPDRLHGTHPVADILNNEYQKLRGKIIPRDWSNNVCKYLTDHCAAAPLRDDGRIYWVAPQYLETVKQAKLFLSQYVGIELVLCQIEQDAVPAVREAAQDLLEAEVTRLQEEAEAFDGTQRKSFYNRRLKEYDGLRERAENYHKALNVNIERTKQILDQLDNYIEDYLCKFEL